MVEDKTAVESNKHYVNAKSISYIKLMFVGKLIPFRISNDVEGLKLNDYTSPSVSMYEKLQVKLWQGADNPLTFTVTY